MEEHWDKTDQLNLITSLLSSLHCIFVSEIDLNNLLEENMMKQHSFPAVLYNTLQRQPAPTGSVFDKVRNIHSCIILYRYALSTLSRLIFDKCCTVQISLTCLTFANNTLTVILVNMVYYLTQ